MHEGRTWRCTHCSKQTTGADSSRHDLCTRVHTAFIRQRVDISKGMQYFMLNVVFHLLLGVFL